MKWFTGHWFRHFFVNGMLDRIAEAPLDLERKADLRFAFANYMGWRNTGLMLRYYGRHHFEQETDQIVADYQDGLNVGLGEEFDEEDLLEPANDNGFVFQRPLSRNLLG